MNMHKTGLIFILLLWLQSMINCQQDFSCNRTAACGCSKNTAIITRIAGGEAAANDSWGWMVKVLLNETKFCGGTIISDWWVLSASACTNPYPASAISVINEGNTIVGQRQKRSVAQIIPHPDYNNETKMNSVVLLRLAAPFNMSGSSINRICLPSTNIFDYPPMNTSLVAIGWGPQNYSGPASLILQQATLQRIPSISPSCVEIMTNGSVQFCASAFNYSKNICRGDIGGPLMMFTSSRQWVLVGIQTYSYACVNSGYPSMHVRITAYLDWMRSMNVTGTVNTDTDFPYTMPTLVTTATTLRSTNVNIRANSTRSSESVSLNHYHEKTFIWKIALFVILRFISN